MYRRHFDYTADDGILQYVCIHVARPAIYYRNPDKRAK